MNEAVAATALPVAIGDAHEFVVEGETFVNKFTSFAAVRNNVAETPGLKWALPKQYVAAASLCGCRLTSGGRWCVRQLSFRVHAHQ